MTYSNLAALMGLWCVAPAVPSLVTAPEGACNSARGPIEATPACCHDVRDRRYLPIYTGRPNMTDTSYYGIRLAYQNSTTGTNFFEGCIDANVSSVRGSAGRQQHGPARRATCTAGFAFFTHQVPPPFPGF
jgi:hypothetical protein